MGTCGLPRFALLSRLVSIESLKETVFVVAVATDGVVCHGKGKPLTNVRSPVERCVQLANGGPVDQLNRGKAVLEATKVFIWIEHQFPPVNGRGLCLHNLKRLSCRRVGVL